MTGKSSQSFIELMKQYRIQPNGVLGQHILLDEWVLEKIGGYVHRGSCVLEIGSGPGNLTIMLAKKAKKVIAIEIDHRKFAPVLEDLAKKVGNIELRYVDVLTLDLQKIVDGNNKEWQIVANLPYHISEPFMRMIVGLPLENAVLMVGEKLARSLQQENLDSHEFTKTSLLASAFFDTQIALKVHKSSFYPVPRTDSAVVILTPLTKEEYVNNPRLLIIRQLFLTERKNSTVAKVVKEVVETLIPKYSKVPPKELKSRNERRKRMGVTGDGGGDREEVGKQEQTTRLQFKVEELGIPPKILSTPFSRLSSEETRVLAKALQKRFGV